LSGLDGRVTLKVNRYRTAVSTATLSGELSNSYLIGAGEARATSTPSASPATSRGRATTRGKILGTTSAASPYGAGKVLRWEPARQFQIDPNDASKGYTQAGIDQQYTTMRKSVEAWNSNPIPKSMQDAWGMTDYATGGGSWSMNSVAVTGDTLSEGTEFELAVNPIKGLNIAMNASKTDAKRLEHRQGLLRLD